ncbi:MAG: DUF4296 domain-containing protein [Candidatus Saccharimonadaceae bacterium]
MDKLVKYLCVLILATMFFSCQNRPSEVLSRKKMENLMYDMYIAEAIIDNDYQEYSQPEKKEALISEVLKKHKIAAARWDTSLSWYSDNIEQYLQINDSVKARLQRNQKEIDRLTSLQESLNRGEEVKPLDYIPFNFRIASLSCGRGFKFTLDSLQLVTRFADKDTIFFRFNLLGIYPLDSYSLKSILKINYTDTTVYQSSLLNENRLYSFPLLRSIEKDTIVSVDGFVNLSGRFPHIPIQLYQISLGQIENIKDSFAIVPEVNVERLKQMPQQITE